MKTNKVTLLVCALFAMFACKGLTPDQQRRVDKYECRVAAIAPYTDGVLDATQLVQDVYSGKTDLPHVMSLLEVSQPDFLDLLVRLEECDQPSVK